MKNKFKVAFLAVLANAVLAILKVFVGLTTGITSVLADGINSASDVFASSISFIGIKMAEKPEDDGHPYGHQKYEVISGLIITIILFFTGLWILLESINSIVTPKVFTEINYIAFSVMAVSAIVNFIMSKYKIKIGKDENSISLLSDGIHSRVDVYTSLIVLIGVTISFIFPIADGIVAAIIGVYIIKESFVLGKEASDSLLDASAGEEIENKIKNIIAQERIELNELKTQKKGAKITVNIEISLPKNISVEKATRTTKNLRKKLFNKMKELNYVSIQIKDKDYSESYFSPNVGKGFGWKGERKNQLCSETYCICEDCNYKIKHSKKVSCSSIKCPICKEKMKIKNNN